MGYLYSGTDQQQDRIRKPDKRRTGYCLSSYFDIEEDGSLRLNYLSEYLIESMHAQGIKCSVF